MSLPLLLHLPSEGSPNLRASSEGSCALSFCPLLSCHPYLPLVEYRQQVWDGWAASTCAWGLLPFGAPGLLPHSRFFQAVSEVSDGLRGIATKVLGRCCNGTFCYSENCLPPSPLKPLAHAQPCSGAAWRLTSGTKLKIIYLLSYFPAI